MEYNFREIEQKWQQHWKETQAYKVSNQSTKPKYYVLDMFPYPSGAGLHVGHPLGYIASDIFSRYKRLKGFNVLHPMGYDAFGLPAEQYAIEHGVHPAISTSANINNFRKQLDKIGFCYDWDRQVNTSEAQYYKWTQWIFLQLFKSFYNRKSQKAEPISQLIAAFEKVGNINHPIPDSNFLHPDGIFEKSGFTAENWASFTEKQQQDILMEYRLAFCGHGEVNWCEALGTVLANDEVINGVSERGGYPVVKKKLRQWYLRITEYADRLLEGLDRIEFSESMKEMQTNWIGKSYGAEISFALTTHQSLLTVYTTRPDTIFGVDFMVVAPEHELVSQITTADQKAAVDEYVAYVNSRSERERQAEKKISGCFTGAYAINPFNGKQIPVWISEYVLAGYGTGAIMAVPCGDDRDFKFAQHFNIPITNILGDAFNGTEANPTKDALLQNSEFLDGTVMRDAMQVVIDKLVELGIGKKKVNYRMRDAAFSRQRYWGEPFPIVWKNGIAYPLDENELPLELPVVDKYGPGPEGEGPLSNLTDWNLIPFPSPSQEKGASAQQTSTVPKYKVGSLAQFEAARQMRKGHTEAEGMLWEAIRNEKLGVKFRRQHPIEAYIVDFVCLQKALIIELDGGYHETEEQQQYDAERTRILEEVGFKVIRFTNEQILHRLLDSLKAITLALQEQDAAKTNNVSSTEAPLSYKGEGMGVRETNTMPGYAGSSWYFLRYMDPENATEFAGRQATDYWNQVDLYIGGTEHAVGHLLYSRLWTKALYDLGHIGFDEPFKKLVNQGMITGFGYFFEKLRFEETTSTSAAEQFESGKAEKVDVRYFYGNEDYLIRTYGSTGLQQYGYSFRCKQGDDPYRLPYVNDYVDSEGKLYKQRFLEYLENEGKGRLPFGPDDVYWECDGKEHFATPIKLAEKMSKSKFNTVNPDDLVNRFGADTFRMYEMFLGPVEQSKPWDTKGIEGVHRFLKKLWRLFYDENKGFIVTNEAPTAAELKVLHKTIKKIEDDTERFSFNTAVSGFMIAVNELNDLKCNKAAILEQLVTLLVPYAPHVAEELYHALGKEGSVLDASYPVYNAAHTVESSKEYPVSINGKVRTTMNLPLDAAQADVETQVLADETVQKWMEGKPVKKFIFVKGRMINLVI